MFRQGEKELLLLEGKFGCAPVRLAGAKRFTGCDAAGV